MKTILIYVALTAVGATGCYHSRTVETPAGEETSRTYALGLVHTERVDTMVSFDRCRKLLKPGRDNTAMMIDREVYDKCFSDAMVGVAPRGQHPAPTPVDTNGDGIPDAVRYVNGATVPYDLFQMYPALNWPGIYQHYGIVPGMMPYGPISYGYDTRMRIPGMAVGDPGRPALQGTPYGYVTRKEHNDNMTSISEALVEEGADE